MNEQLNITEIYSTLQGEGPSTGRPATFLRLAGCSLRCQYCDSEYTFSGGEVLNFYALIEKIKSLGNDLIVVTGGEPLDQKPLANFLTQLLAEEFEVELETSGHKLLSEIPTAVRVLMDVKTPGSKMQKHFKEENLNLLDEGDILKFVICDKEDYQWCKDWLSQLEKPLKAQVWFSPTHPTDTQEGLEPKDLAEWILKDKLLVRLQLQQHKLIWGDERSR